MGELFHTREGLHHSIDALHCWLKSCNAKLWSIIRERETCEASVRELEAALAVEASTDEEEELVQERARDEVKRWLVACQRGRRRKRRRKAMRRMRMRWRTHPGFWQR